MKPQLLVLEWMRDGEVGWWRHPAYNNLRQHVFCGKAGYPTSLDTSALKDALSSFNAQLVQQGSNTWIKFESQEDLTQFVLAWS